MAILDPHGVITLQGDGTVDQLFRRAVARIEAIGYDVIAVIDHSGEAAEAGLTMPDTTLVLFGRPHVATQLMLTHPLIALDLPLKLLVGERGDGRGLVSYNAPDYLARRYGLTADEGDVFRVVESIARTIRSSR